MWSSLNENQGAALVLLTLALVGVTTYYAIKTHQMQATSQKQYRSNSIPIVVVDLGDKQTEDGFEIAIVNIGVGPGLDVTFEWKPGGLRSQVSLEDSPVIRGILASQQSIILQFRADPIGIRQCWTDESVTNDIGVLTVHYKSLFERQGIIRSQLLLARLPNGNGYFGAILNQTLAFQAPE